MKGERIKFALFLASIPLLFAISVIGWRVDYFLISDDDELIFAVPAANGNKFTTRYIHSVEQTPVEDEYRIISGKIWVWEERVRSSNAGLPSTAPAKGRFINSGEWLIYQGGRSSVYEYYYRVGNQYFGFNQMDFAPFGRRDFYKIYMGKRLRVSVKTRNLIFAKPYAAEKLRLSPANVPPATRD